MFECHCQLMGCPKVGGGKERWEYRSTCNLIPQASLKNKVCIGFVAVT